MTIREETVKEKALPKGWREVKLSEVCKIITSPVDKRSVEGELPVKLCNYKDVYYNNVIDSSIVYMTATAKPQEIEKFSLAVDDVIITKDSETPDDIGVPAYVKETMQNLLCGYHLTILRPQKEISGRYISYFLNSQRINYDFYRFANGITRFGLTNESYRKIKILVPPLPEQKAIASLLEKWDTAIEKTEALIAAKHKQFEWLKKFLLKNQKGEIKKLKNLMREVCVLHNQKNAIVAAVGKKGIRNRNEIYYKELSKDYTKNKLVKTNEIAFGLANDRIVYGVNLSKNIYSVSPAYKVFSIYGCNSLFLNYFLDVNNRKLSLKFLITSARQGKSVDFIGLLNENHKFPPLEKQKEIAETLNTAKKEINLLRTLTNEYHEQKRGLMQKLLTGKWGIRI